MIQFAAGVANLRRAGYDGVELHLTHGMLVETFLSAHWNRRTDEYGGTTQKRLRFARELLEAARDAAGPEMAVGCGSTATRCCPTASMSRRAGDPQAICGDGLVDFVDLDAAVEPEQWTA